MPGPANPSGAVCPSSLRPCRGWGEYLACVSASRSRATSALVVLDYAASLVALRDRGLGRNPQSTDVHLERNPALAISCAPPGIPYLSWRARAWSNHWNVTSTHQPFSLLTGRCHP